MQIDSGTPKQENEGGSPKVADAMEEDEEDEEDEDPLPLTEEDKLNDLMKKAKEEAMQELKDEN